jgi:ribosomal protein S17E
MFIEQKNTLGLQILLKIDDQIENDFYQNKKIINNLMNIVEINHHIEHICQQKNE